MKLNINENIYCNCDVKLRSFTEYGMKYTDITSSVLYNNIVDSGVHYNSIILMPMTHINNIWHLMHHLFITWKSIYTQNISCENMYPIFFNNFYKKQGDIENCIYNDLIFTGLGLNIILFKNNKNHFDNNKYINVDKVHTINDNINFYKEPLFDNFKKTILNNFSLVYEKNIYKKITFILRHGTREITNIDYVKEGLEKYDVDYIYLENYTIKEQLEMIMNTDILLGVHGAGLTWGIFMKPNSVMIEMYPGNSNTDNYIRWCNISSIRYCRISINITQGNEREFRNSTVNIDIKQMNHIKEIINQINHK